MSAEQQELGKKSRGIWRQYAAAAAARLIDEQTGRGGRGTARSSVESAAGAILARLLKETVDVWERGGAGAIRTRRCGAGGARAHGMGRSVWAPYWLVAR